MYHPLLYTLALTGCTEDIDRTATPGLEPDQRASALVEPERLQKGGVTGDGYTREDAAMDQRWILRRRLGQSCPDLTADGWDITSLFDAPADGALPPALARYCLFERPEGWDGSAGTNPGLLGAERDLAVVAGLAVPTAEEVGASFEEQIEPFPDYLAVPTHKARLTLLDSSPTEAAGSPDVYEGVGFYAHGQQIATLALRGVCDDDASPTCVVDLATQLALGYRYNGGDFQHSASGGIFGSQGDLARAIHAAVDDWKAAVSADPAAGPGPLVLNLSLGWHPEAGGAATPYSPAVAAVKDALTYASCQGVLVLAAVGNVDTPLGAADGAGPLYPAAWESEAAPRARDCYSTTGSWRLDPSLHQATSLTTYTPLLYGVSGVDVDRRSLANQRPEASTPHVAAGSHLTAFNTGTGGFLTPVTGTSASTVVVASAAAVVRSHAPNLSPHDVMQVLRDASGVLPDAPATCYDAAGDGCSDEATHYVTVCDSLSYACAAGYATCDPAYAATTCSSSEAAAPLTGLGPRSTVLRITGVYTTDVCGSGTVITDTTRMTTACPYEELYAGTALPMTLPQPPGSECPWCPASLPNRVDLRTTSNMRTMGNTTITVERSGVVTHYALGSVRGTTLTVFLPPNPFDGTPALDSSVTGVLLSYTYGAGSIAYTEPLYMMWTGP